LVIIDPGHGGQDSGTIKTGLVEKDLALDVAHRLERHLQQRGFVTLLTRGDDTYVSLQDARPLQTTSRTLSSSAFTSTTLVGLPRPESKPTTPRIGVSCRNGSPHGCRFCKKSQRNRPTWRVSILAGFHSRIGSGANTGDEPRHPPATILVVTNVRHPARSGGRGFSTKQG